MYSSFIRIYKQVIQRGSFCISLHTLACMRSDVPVSSSFPVAHYRITAVLWPNLQPCHVPRFPLANGSVQLVQEYHLFHSLTEPKNRSYYPITFRVHRLWLCLHLNKALHDWIKWLRSIGHMFISQGPLGSPQAGKKKICWVSSVTFIGYERSYMSFFSLFSTFHLFRFQEWLH